MLSSDTSAEPVCILHLEDNPNDAELIQISLENQGIDCRMKVVSTREAFVAELEEGGHDLILSDFTLPSFDGETALHLAREISPQIPFVYVSGTIGEESAVRALLNGATDYLLKSNLKRLPAAVLRALQEAQQRKKERQLKEALLESEAKYRRIVETTEEGIWMIDGQGRTVFANGRLAAMLGYDPEEMLGRVPTDFAFPADRQSAKDGLASLFRGLREVKEVRYQRKDGSELWATLATTPLMEEGRFIGGLGMLTDITERKRLEGQLLQSQKMETIGQLAGGIAHDFNNMIQVVLGYAQFVLNEVPPDSKNAKDLQQIIVAAGRAAELSRQLLTFSRRGEIAFGPLDVRPLIQEMAAMLERTFPASIHIQLEIESDLPSLWADPTRIQQVLMNLFVNARDAMPEGGEIRIGARRVRFNQGDPPPSMDIALGSCVMLSVSDSGTGISPEHLERIFEPFFTTKGVGLGTGLGLSASYGIVKQHNGCLLCESEVGKGTIFRVYLPESRPAEGQADLPPDSADEVQKGHETILLAEDRPEIRLFLERCLMKRGYSVQSVEDGNEALDEFFKNPQRADLVILDFQMPGLDGLRCADAILQKAPQTKILLLTGFADQDLHQRVLAAGVKGVIEKPISPDQMAAIVRRTLDEESAQGPISSS